MKPSCLIAALAVAAAQCSSPTAPDTIVPVVRLQTEAFSGFTFTKFDGTTVTI